MTDDDISSAISVQWRLTQDTTLMSGRTLPPHLHDEALVVDDGGGVRGCDNSPHRHALLSPTSQH